MIEFRNLLIPTKNIDYIELDYKSSLDDRVVVTIFLKTGKDFSEIYERRKLNTFIANIKIKFGENR